MKTAAISRFMIVAAIAALVVVGGSTAAWAQVTCPDASPNFTPDFTSGPNCLTLNPAESTTPQFVVTGEPSHTVVRLTTDAPGQVGSAWFNTQQPVQGGFSTTFRFQFTQQGNAHTPADGIAFVIQNSSLSALGQGGGSIGYADGAVFPIAWQLSSIPITTARPPEIRTPITSRCRAAGL